MANRRRCAESASGAKELRTVDGRLNTHTGAGLRGMQERVCDLGMWRFIMLKRGKCSFADSSGQALSLEMRRKNGLKTAV